MKSLKAIIKESLLDLDAQLNKKINIFSLLFKANSEKEYTDIFNTLIHNSSKIIPVKITSAFNADLNLKRGKLYIVSSLGNNTPFIYIGIYGKSKIINIYWDSREECTNAVIYNNPITYLSSRDKSWYEIPSNYLNDFNEFKEEIKKKK